MLISLHFPLPISTCPYQDPSTMLSSALPSRDNCTSPTEISPGGIHTELLLRGPWHGDGRLWGKSVSNCPLYMFMASTLTGTSLFVFLSESAFWSPSNLQHLPSSFTQPNDRLLLYGENRNIRVSLRLAFSNPLPSASEVSPLFSRLRVILSPYTLDPILSCLPVFIYPLLTLLLISPSQGHPS